MRGFSQHVAVGELCGTLPIPLAKEQLPVKQVSAFRVCAVRVGNCGPPWVASKQFKVRGSDAREPGVRFEERWPRMEVGVPMSPGLEDDEAQGRRVTAESPFLKVRHEMRVGWASSTPAMPCCSCSPPHFVLLTRAAAPLLASTFVHVVAPFRHPLMSPAVAPRVTALNAPPGPSHRGPPRARARGGVVLGEEVCECLGAGGWVH